MLNFETIIKSLERRKWKKKLIIASVKKETCLLATLVFFPSVEASPDPDDFFQPFVMDSFRYDNNLYRLSSNSSANFGPGTRKEDWINTASVGAVFHKSFKRQVFDINLLWADQRYIYNNLLDHNQTQDSAVWKWALGENWSGRIGMDYSQSLAGFANTLFLSKDLLTQTGYFA